MIRLLVAAAAAVHAADALNRGGERLSSLRSDGLHSPASLCTVVSMFLDTQRVHLGLWPGHPGLQSRHIWLQHGYAGLQSQAHASTRRRRRPPTPSPPRRRSDCHRYRRLHHRSPASRPGLPPPPSSPPSYLPSPWPSARRHAPTRQRWSAAAPAPQPPRLLAHRGASRGWPRASRALRGRAPGHIRTAACTRRVARLGPVWLLSTDAVRVVMHPVRFYVEARLADRMPGLGIVLGVQAAQWRLRRERALRQGKAQS